MDFFDALREAKNTGRRIKHVSDNNFSKYIMNAFGGAHLECNKAPHVWWPNVIQQSGDWEVEQEEIFVWAACDSDGMSYLFSGDPQKITEDGSFQWDNGDSPIELNELNLFPKNKAIKYKLVPVDG
jgi:hypothetical protein